MFDSRFEIMNVFSKYGLRQDLKDGKAHKYDSINDFDELRVAMRTVEEERKLKLNQSINMIKLWEDGVPLAPKIPVSDRWGL